MDEVISVFQRGGEKMIKKLYKWAAVIMSVKIGIEAHSFHEMFTALFCFLITLAYQLCGYNKAQQAVHQQHRKFHVFMVRHRNRMQRAE